MPPLQAPKIGVRVHQTTPQRPPIRPARHSLPFFFLEPAHGAFLAEKSRDFFLLPRDHGGSRARCEWRNQKVLLSPADPARAVSRAPTSFCMNEGRLYPPSAEKNAPKKTLSIDTARVRRCVKYFDAHSPKPAPLGAQ